MLRGSGKLALTEQTPSRHDRCFQTPSARPGVHGQVFGRGGGLGLGRFRGNISYGDPGNKFGVNAALSRTAYTKGIDGEDNAGNTNFQSRFDYKPSSKTDLSARLFVSDANVRLNVSPDTFGILPPAGTIIDAKEGINSSPIKTILMPFRSSRFLSGTIFGNYAITSEFVVAGITRVWVTKRTNATGARTGILRALSQTALRDDPDSERSRRLDTECREHIIPPGTI